MDEQARWGTCESVIEEIDRQCLTSLHLYASWFDIATDETVPGGQPEGRQDQSEPGDGDDHDLLRPHALLFLPLSDCLRGQRSTSRSRLTQERIVLALVVRQVHRRA